MELLQTPRVTLRRWTTDDADAFLEVYRRDDVTRWLGQHPRRPVADRAEALQRLARWHAHEADLPLPMGLWALVEGRSEQPAHQPGNQPAHHLVHPGRSGTPVGTVLLLPLQDAGGPTDQVEVGWHLHPDHQGRGLVTEAARALLAAAAEQGVREVLALTDLDNTRSQAVAARLGMADEGTTDRWFGLTTRQYRLALASS